MLKFSFKNIKIIPLTYIAFVLCTTGLPLYLGGYIFIMKAAIFDINLIGKKYGLVTILEGRDIKKGRRMVLGRCDCGIEKEFKLASLISGRSQSCGCIRKTTCSKNFTTHSLSGHPLNSVWNGIKNRCYSENEPCYERYGAKGVIMCDLWLNDFKHFYDWCIAHGWREGLQIDKDIIPRKLGIPALLYSPEMCSIVTAQENCNSRSSNKIFKIDGIDYTLMQLSVKYGINYKALFARVKLGWDIQTALQTPLFKIRGIQKA